MKIDRDCKHCGIRFNARRRNHLYCSDECRYERGNDRHRNKMAPFERDKQMAVEQDLVFKALYRRYPSIYIEEKKFKLLKINIDAAKTCIRQPDGKLISARFTNYILDRVDDQAFQLKKI